MIIYFHCAQYKNEITIFIYFYKSFIQYFIIYQFCKRLIQRKKKKKTNYNLWMNNDAIRFRRSKISLQKKKWSMIEKLVNERGNLNGNEWSFLESRELHEKKTTLSEIFQSKIVCTLCFLYHPHLLFLYILRQFEWSQCDFMFLCFAKDLFFFSALYDFICIAMYWKSSPCAQNQCNYSVHSSSRLNT